MNAPIHVAGVRRCAVCDTSLEGRHPRTRFCSARCRGWAHRNPDGLSALALCMGCGETFHRATRRQRWCSGRCRSRGWRGTASRSRALAAQWDLEARDFWRTPPWLFARLDAEFHFGLDAATAGPSDALCERFLTPDDDALTCTWRDHCDPERLAVFNNPPYSRKGGRGAGLLAWARAAVRARDTGLVVVMLVPPSPGTRYHRLLHREAVELRMPNRRLAFLHPDTGKPTAGNRGDSMVAILRPGQSGPAVTTYFSRQDNP